MALFGTLTTPITGGAGGLTGASQGANSGPSGTGGVDVSVGAFNPPALTQFKPLQIAAIGVVAIVGYLILRKMRK